MACRRSRVQVSLTPLPSESPCFKGFFHTWKVKSTQDGLSHFSYVIIVIAIKY